MRITLVMASAEDGGLEKHVIELANGLAKMHKVSLIAHGRFAQLANESVQFIDMDLSGSRYNPWTKYQLKKKILATEPDVLHVHAAKTAQFLQSMVQKFKFPCVVTVHGQKKKNQINLAFDRIIVVSHKLKEQFQNSSKVSVVYNGVEQMLTPRQFQKNRKFIAIGRLNEVKGFDVLLKAWQSIPYQLTIAGEGEQRHFLEQLIRDLNLEDRVKLVGFQNEIQKLINEHEALIVSSLREGGPYTLGEALLLKRPVLGTQVGMMQEFIADKWLCEPNHIEELHQLITEYCKLEDPAAEFGKAFDLAQQHLTIEQMLMNTEAVYIQAILELQR